ncbi:hypothetical protein OH77DRAFT_1505938 [Trametes cingulata]|nr:hypothetical protein OH77DRAFT_1505938 [Trametes cingulata]
MSASPQPPPPAPAHRDEPVAQTNGSPPASSSPAQLAALLTKSLQEAEALKAELAQVKRRAEKAERLLATFQSSSQSPPNASPPGSSQGASSKPQQLPEAARKAILESENRAERAEQARDEAEARLRMLQESWTELDRFLVQMEVRNADARSQFSRIVAEAGGTLVPVTSLPSQNNVYLPTALQQPVQLPPLLSTRSHVSTRARVPGSSQPFPSVALPPPPSASSSRVRPRAGSMDTAYNGVLTGPGAPPPAKRPRGEHDSDRGRGRHYSLSPSNSPYPAHLSNGHSVDHSPPLTVHHANTLPSRHPHSSYKAYHPSSCRSDRDDPAAARYAPGAYIDQHRHRRERGRSTSRDRDHSSRSRSRSRASSLSLEEMLIEATTTPAEERPGPDGHMQQRPVHPSQHLHPSARHRSPSPRRDAEYHLAVPGQHSRARAHSSVQLHPSAHTSGPIASPPGPLAVPGQVQTYQTHIFAPPVTGAPVKKSKLGAASSTLSANGSVLTLGPSGSVISGPSTIGGGGFPPTNAQGQRICRQCGLPGRYKEGKCVEKWGPGPEGPGTVCDRCRKKMKRVERRGTLDGQNLAAQMHHPPAAIHPSGAPQAAPGGLANGRSIHRSDTMHVHPSSHSQGRALGPSGTHILSSSGSSSQSSYVRHDRDRERERDRDRDYDRPATPHSHYSSGSRPAQRSPPTPPYIATLPGSSANDEDAAYDDAPRSRASRAASRERPSHGHAHKSSITSLNGHRSGEGSASSRSASHSPVMPAKTAAAGPSASARGSPRESDGKSKSSELMDVDADGEEVDADAEADVDADAEADADADAEADAEADADAELLEAVDAAEANNATDEEWLKKEDA